MEKMLDSKLGADTVENMSSETVRIEAEILRQEYTKTQDIRWVMKDVENTTPHVIDLYVTQELRTLQARKFGMPGLETATPRVINQAVMHMVTEARINAIDDLRDSLIGLLPQTHLLYVTSLALGFVCLVGTDRRLRRCSGVHPDDQVSSHTRQLWEFTMR